MAGLIVGCTVGIGVLLLCSVLAFIAHSRRACPASLGVFNKTDRADGAEDFSPRGTHLPTAAWACSDAGKEYVCFLSHYKVECAATARILHMQVGS